MAPVNNYFKNIFYCYSITVVPVFLPLPSSALPTPCSHTVNPHTVVHACGSFIHALCLVPSPSLYLYHPPPLWSLSFCSMFPCLWFYFVRYFILFIRFLLWVRSYGICLSPTSLFHLAWHFPVPSMLSQKVGVLSFCCIIFHCVNLLRF